MHASLENWLAEFRQAPDATFDRLVCGLVPLGMASNLSLYEIFESLFAPGDATLDAAIADWLKRHLLSEIPHGLSPAAWASILDELFRAIGPLELPATGVWLRDNYEFIRIWLSGFREGPHRDPDGSYLTALARSQSDQRFSSLWRRLILRDERSERDDRTIGILGFRKMPDANGRPAADVPEGLLQALIDLAQLPGMEEADWTQTMRSIFAAYPRAQASWIKNLRPWLPPADSADQIRAIGWVQTLLPGIERRETKSHEPKRGAVSAVPYAVTHGWIERIKADPTECKSAEFRPFLEQHRAYAHASGHTDFLVKTLNNLATQLRRHRGFTQLAIGLAKEALDWEPGNVRNWMTYAQTLHANRQYDEAIGVLWQARARFPGHDFARNELGKFLRQNGDLEASERVLREAVSQFPGDATAHTSLAETLRAREKLADARDVYKLACERFPHNEHSHTGLAETLREMGKLAEAHTVFEKARRKFPNDVVCRTSLGDLLLELDEVDAAEVVFQEAVAIDEQNAYARSGLAEVWFIQSARSTDRQQREELREKSRSTLGELQAEGDRLAPERLRNFDSRWQHAVDRGGAKFDVEHRDESVKAKRPPARRKTSEMTAAERLGRALVALWQAEHSKLPAERAACCDEADELLRLTDDAEAEDLLGGFIETRGFLLLARGDAAAARTYFLNQIQRFGRGGWAGIQLGLERANQLLGETATSDERLSLLTEMGQVAVQVARVVHRLISDGRSPDLCELLKQLYPLAVQFMQASDELESDRHMIGEFLVKQWFEPADIHSAADLDQPHAVDKVALQAKATQADLFHMLSSAVSRPVLVHAA